MRTVYVSDKKSLLKETEQLQPGDCVQINSFADIAGSAKEMVALLQKILTREADFVSLQEDIDTRGEQKAGVLALCQALYALDRSELRKKQQHGIEQAREDGKYKGRKPIEIDWTKFGQLYGEWKSKNITGRDFMRRMGLSANTFYRRVREYEATHGIAEPTSA